METVLFFKCNEILKINVTALLCISDNTIMKKSLYSGRTDQENDYRHIVRYNTKETCYPSCRGQLLINNPTLGHYVIVALIVNDYFKGDYL